MTGVKRSMMAAAHPTGPVEGEYVEDVFATNVWTGDNGSNRGIVNGCDLDGEGGMVWIKGRTFAASGLNHLLCDTLRPVSGGGAPRLMPNSGGTEAAYASGLKSFNDDGYSIGAAGDTNSTTTGTYVGWAFRQAAGFFDMVKYTGNGNDQSISHNLGSTPGFALIKGIDTGNANWITWHRSHGNDKYSVLNSASSNGGDLNASRTVTSTTFEILGDGGWSGYFDEEGLNGREYMLYLFAHDDESFGPESDESIIQCGGYTGNGSSDGPEITLGWEPQWVMIKNIDDDAGDNTHWLMADNMRGMVVGGGSPSYGKDRYLAANSADPEYTTYDWIHPTATGFKLTNTGASLNSSSVDYIYIAIRRPMKVPTAATEVFAIDTEGSAGSLPGYRSGFPVDMALRPETAGGTYVTCSRFTQGSQLGTNNDSAESQYSQVSAFDWMNGFSDATGTATNRIGYMFKRAPKFFDVVCYDGSWTGGSTQQNVNHNLGVVPEMIWCKRRSAAEDWIIYCSETGVEEGTGLSNAATYDGGGSYWNSTRPTASVFSVKNNARCNTSGYTYIAYLWATLDGISKVGSYTGTGSELDVDCGFSAGARFILIKRTDSTGDWYLFDSVIQGIVSGNDPYILLNTTSSQVTNVDYIDPLSSGFTLTNYTPVGLNDTNGNYIFLAIA